jgi:single-stranded DNA-binding protein
VKGKEIAIEGKLTTEVTTIKNGEKKKIHTEVVAEILLLGK